MAKQHLISKANLRETNWTEGDSTVLQNGQVRLKIDAFALTANNVTYAAFGGPPMHYWNFFPSGNDGHGRVPVWGFATITESTVDGIEVGQKLYGYYPISEELIVEPTRQTERSFMDGAAHRQGLAPIYNMYQFTHTDPAYIEGKEEQQMLFRPLYTTGWMICDSLMDADTPPEGVIISSASSKTAMATAHGLKRKGVRTIGVTSAGNKSFVADTGLYDQILTYDEVADFSPQGTLAYVDFVGRSELTKSIHTVCGSNLIRSMVIGVTDWEGDRTPQADLQGPVPEFFFVPDYAANRAKALPSGELDKRLGTDLIAFYSVSEGFVAPKAVSGANAISQAWLDTVDAKIPPREGLICRF